MPVTNRCILRPPSPLPVVGDSCCLAVNPRAGSVLSFFADHPAVRSVSAACDWPKDHHRASSAACLDRDPAPMGSKHGEDDALSLFTVAASPSGGRDSRPNWRASSFNVINHYVAAILPPYLVPATCLTPVLIWSIGWFDDLLCCWLDVLLRFRDVFS